MTTAPFAPWTPDHGASFTPAQRLRLALAAALHHASVSLARQARRLGSPAAARRRRAQLEAQTLPRLEFHADGAAPEGALYVDGVLFGHLDGVTRL